MWRGNRCWIELIEKPDSDYFLFCNSEWAWEERRCLYVRHRTGPYIWTAPAKTMNSDIENHGKKDISEDPMIHGEPVWFWGPLLECHEYVSNLDIHEWKLINLSKDLVARWQVPNICFCHRPQAATPRVLWILYGAEQLWSEDRSSKWCIGIICQLSTDFLCFSTISEILRWPALTEPTSYISSSTQTLALPLCKQTFLPFSKRRATRSSVLPDPPNPNSLATCIAIMAYTW